MARPKPLRVPTSRRKIIEETSFFLPIRRDAAGFPIPVKRIRRVLGGILSRLGWRRAAVSVLLVKDRKIRVMNRQYLGHDCPTDVIAFSQLEGSGPRVFLGERPFLGDLVISVETAKRQAGVWKTDYFYEICLYLCHGVLHLMGYDDRDSLGAERMWQKQEAVLKELGIRPPRAPRRVLLRGKKTTPGVPGV